MLKRRYSPLKNEKGMAVFEMIPILVVIVLFVNFSLGFFGAIHTGILNSIASRNYAFETFRNRTDLTYFQNSMGSQTNINFHEISARVHGTSSEASIAGGAGKAEWIASSRTIDFANFEKRAADIVGNDEGTHKKVFSDAIAAEKRNKTVGVNPIWIRTTYGICLNLRCGS